MPLAFSSAKQLLEKKGEEDVDIDFRHLVKSAKASPRPSDATRMTSRFAQLGFQPAPAYIQNSPAQLVDLLLFEAVDAAGGSGIAFSASASVA